MKKWLFMGLALLLAMLTACSNTAPTSSSNQSSGQNDTASSGGSETQTVATADQLFVYGDVVSGNGCVLASRFTVGDKIVFRVNVIDPLTGEQVEDAKVAVHLNTGDVLDMELGLHPPNAEDADKFWTVAYEVTEDTPTGTLEYFVRAETDTKSGEFRPFRVAPSMLTIVAAEEAAGNAEQQNN